MMRVLAAVLSVWVATAAGADCLGDFDNNRRVEINELIQAVNNALRGCGPTPCAIDLLDDNTATGATSCFYVGRWSTTCGAADLEAEFISDGELVIVSFSDFTPGLFYVGQVTSATTACLIGWYQQPDASDLENAPGSLRLEDGGTNLIVDPIGAPFVVDDCDFEDYQGAFSRTTGAALLRRGPAPITAAAFARVRAGRGAPAQLRRGATAGK